MRIVGRRFRYPPYINSALAGRYLGGVLWLARRDLQRQLGGIGDGSDISLWSRLILVWLPYTLGNYPNGIFFSVG